MKPRFRPDWERIVAVGLTLLAGAAALCLVLDGAAQAASLPPPATSPSPSAVPVPRYAFVIADVAPLRAGPHDAGPAAAQLVQGEFVELRESRLDFVQVWDHRRERGGYLRASQLREVSLTPAEAPELLALLRFLRDRPGLEPLGLGVAASYLRAVPAGGLTAEPFDALGVLAERLARRANTAKADDAAIAAQIEAAAAIGVSFDSVETANGVRLCYDGEAYRHVFSLHPSPEQSARAALALTRHDCLASNTNPLARETRDHERAALLDRVPEAGLAPWLRDRLRVRRAGVWAAIAFEESRRAVMADEAARPAALVAMREAGQRAIDALASVDKAELADDDQGAYAEAAMRVGASRWAAEVPPAKDGAAGRLAIVTRAGERGETCVLLVDAAHDARAPLARRCTWGTVWVASASVDASQSALALAVQPLDAWREMWVFRRIEAGVAGQGASAPASASASAPSPSPSPSPSWQVQVLPPSADDPSIGYVEFAGWVPGGKELLAAREVKQGGRAHRTFELLSLDTLETERQADTPGSLTPFYRWQDAAWKRQTVSLR